MKRRWFAVMGGGFLALMAVLLVAFGPPETLYTPMVPLVVASVLLVLGGLDPVPGLVPWYRFVGLGELLFGASLVALWFAPAVLDGRGGAEAVLAAVAGVATVLVFGFVGIDWFLGGRHYDLSRIEAGPILGRGTGRKQE